MNFVDLVVTVRRHYKLELDLYDRYHQNTINSYIHVICITCEWFATLLLLRQVHLQLAELCVIILAGFLCIVSCGGILCSLLLAALLYSIEISCSSGDWTVLVAVGLGLGVHMLSWGVQVGIGHYLIEGNSPSMAESLSFYGVLFSLLMAWDNGWRKLISKLK